MKLFRTSQGFIFSFGFDVVSRKPDAHIICWDDPQTGEWETKANNLAGFMRIKTSLDDETGVSDIEFVRETADRAIVAYSPGRCIEIRYIGGVLGFSFNILKARQDWLPDDEARRIVGVDE